MCVPIAAAGTDPENTSTTSADFRTTSAAAEVFGNELNGSDSQNTCYNNNILVRTQDHFRKSGDTQHPEDDCVHASARVCDPEVAEVQNPISLDTHPITDSESQNSPLPLPQVQKSAEG